MTDYPFVNEDENKFIVHHIFSVDEMRQMVGTNWISSSNSVVTISKIEEPTPGWQEIFYEWPPTEHSRGFHNKERFAFQCRYCLLVDDKCPQFVKDNLIETQLQ